MEITTKKAEPETYYLECCERDEHKAERHAVTIFERCAPLLASKAHDYAREDDFHTNFKTASMLATEFPDDYKSYAVLIGVKLARIAQLLQKGETKHESVEDSFVDCLNYVALMYERYMEERAVAKRHGLAQKESTHE